MSILTPNPSAAPPWRHRMVLGTLALLLACGSLLLAGCERIHYRIESPHPILPGNALERPIETTQHFSEQGRRWFLFWGLMEFAGEDNDELLINYATVGDGIVNLRMREGIHFPDALVRLFTLGLVTSRWHSVEGDVFVYRPQAASVNREAIQ